MIRGDNVACVAGSNGTGPFSLLAAPGATDLYTYLTGAQTGGPGFGTNANILTPGSIIEFTDSSWRQIKQMANGMLTVNVGANLAATTVSQTSMLVSSNPNGGTYADQAPGSINVGVAANTLISICDCSWMHPTMGPFLDTTTSTGTDQLGYSVIPNNGGGIQLTFDASGDDWFSYFVTRKPFFVRRVTTFVFTGAGAVTSNAFGRIYQVGSNGRPGKLIYDFGQLGTAGSSLNTTGATISSGLKTGVFLPPGEYFFNLQASWSGGSPIMGAGTQIDTSSTLITRVRGVTAWTTVATGGSPTAPDPANTTSYALTAGSPSSSFSLILNNQ